MTLYKNKSIFIARVQPTEKNLFATVADHVPKPRKNPLKQKKKNLTQLTAYVSEIKSHAEEISQNCNGMMKCTFNLSSHLSAIIFCLV